jgi:hypothetical protein
MPARSLAAPLTVVRYWPDFLAAAAELLNHPDPRVRWRERRFLGRAFAVRAKRLGSRLLARDVPTGLNDSAYPETTAVFAPLDSICNADLDRWAARTSARLARRSARLRTA